MSQAEARYDKRGDFGCALADHWKRQTDAVEH